MEFARSGYSLHVARGSRGEERRRGNALRAEMNEIKPDFIPINFKNFGISVLFDCMIYKAHE